MLSDVYNVTATITWILPCRVNGKLIGFKGNFDGQREGFERHLLEWNLEVDDENRDEEDFTYLEMDLKPEYSYTISVIVMIDNFNEENERYHAAFESPAGSKNDPLFLCLCGELILIEISSFNSLSTKFKRSY